MKIHSEKIVKARRRQEIELLRLISIFGVIWFHASVIGKDLAYSGLVIFLIISMFFSYSSDGGITSQINRSKKIFLPWFFWFLFYGIINLLLGKPFIDVDKGYLGSVLAGTTIHLWYIPFIVVMSIFIVFFKNIFSHALLGCMFFLFIIINIVSIDYWRVWSLNLGYPWAQYFQALNGVFFGIFLAISVNLNKYLLSMLVSVIVFLYYLFALDVPGVGVPYIVGILITALCILPNWDFKFKINVSYFSECTFGIYLCHVFWLMLFRKVLVVSGINLPVIVFLLSLLTVMGIKKILPEKSMYIV